MASFLEGGILWQGREKELGGHIRQYVVQLNKGMWSIGQLTVHVQISANHTQYFSNSRYAEQGRRNTWHLFPGLVARGVLGNRHCAMPFWKSVSALEDSLSLKKSKKMGFHTAPASQHNNYTKQSGNKIKEWKLQKEPFPKTQLMHSAKPQHQWCGSLFWGVSAHGQRASHQGTSVAVEMGNTGLLLTGKW